MVTGAAAAASGLTVITCKSSSGRKTRRSTTTRNCSSAKRIVELLAFTTCAIIWKIDHSKLWAAVTERRQGGNETHRIYKLVGILWLVKLSEGDGEEG